MMEISIIMQTLTLSVNKLNSFDVIIPIFFYKSYKVFILGDISGNSYYFSSDINLHNT